MELQVGEFAFAGGRYFTGFVRDLTERQEAERRIQDLQAELLHASRLSVMVSRSAIAAPTWARNDERTTPSSS